MKKVVCLIDHLGSGGAQRQMIYLCNLLKEKGYDTYLVYYHDITFLKGSVKDVSVLKYVSGSNKFVRLIKVLKQILKIRPEVIISYESGPNSIAALYKAFFGIKNVKFISSERSFNVYGFQKKDYFIRLHHLVASHVICNSKAQAELMKKEFPHLDSEIKHIPNVLDFEKFVQKANFNFVDKFRFVVPASYTSIKNPLGLAEAVLYLRKEYPKIPFSVEWFGSRIMLKNSEHTELSKTYEQVKNFIQNNSLENYFILRDADPKLNQKLHEYCCLILPSFYEGCPNAIMDGMACKLPILASNIGDNRYIVEDGKGGFLFDPTNPVDIANSMLKIMALSANERQNIGNNNYSKARKMFSKDCFVKAYEDLFN